MREKDPKTYQIGQFSKLTGIPISSLRFYDAKELLVPQLRDASSKYRYYEEDQVLQALTLTQYKMLGLPLPDIKKFMEHRDMRELKSYMEERIQIYQDKIERLEIKYQETQRLYDLLGRGSVILEEFQQEDLDAISIRYWPDTQIVCKRFRTVQQMNAKVLRGYAELNRICDQEKLQIKGVLSLCILGYQSGELEQKEQHDALLYYPVRPTRSKHTAVNQLEGCWMVSTYHRGYYHHAALTFRRLEEYIRDHALTVVGNPIEQYILGSTNIENEEDYVTRISFPIAEPEEE